MKFMCIDGLLLKNPFFTPTDKFILTFLLNLQKMNKRYWGEPGWLAGELGLKTDYVEKRMKFLEDHGLISRNESGWTTNRPVWEIYDWVGN